MCRTWATACDDATWRPGPTLPACQSAGQSLMRSMMRSPTIRRRPSYRCVLRRNTRSAQRTARVTVGCINEIHFWTANGGGGAALGADKSNELEWETFAMLVMNP